MINMPEDITDILIKIERAETAELGTSMQENTYVIPQGENSYISQDINNSDAEVPGINELYFHLKKSLENAEYGPWKNIPEDIFVTTMGCFSRFVKEHLVSYGCYGFDRGFWTMRQVNAKLFRIGELEYEMEDGDNKNIQMHIPSDARLDPELLNDSVSKARNFFVKYFPERKNGAILLDSWLLSPALCTLLPGDSRILMFQAAFDVTDTNPDALDYLEWVFKIPGRQIENAVITDLPESTSLQKNMKIYLLKGGKVGTARGILARRF